ncbi:MAG: hypothetical protein JXR38_03205, partial [Bacilli bacterium]|nr:hypothetical protein [Bacilli bacterium]
MRNVLTIFKKEWDRVIKDKRLVFSVMLLPGLMIFILYSFIGSAIGSLYVDLDERIAIVNAPASFVTMVDTAMDDAEWEYLEITDQSVSEYMQKIDEAEWELLLVFPSDFETSVSDAEKP